VCKISFRLILNGNRPESTIRQRKKKKKKQKNILFYGNPLHVECICICIELCICWLISFIQNGDRYHLNVSGFILCWCSKLPKSLHLIYSPWRLQIADHLKWNLYYSYIVTWGLKARIVEQVEKDVAWERPCKPHVISGYRCDRGNATVEKLWDEVSSVMSAPIPC
jgi:hypothetical protein